MSDSDEDCYSEEWGKMIFGICNGNIAGAGICERSVKCNLLIMNIFANVPLPG